MECEIIIPTLEEYKNMLEAFKAISNPNASQLKTIRDLESYIYKNENEGNQING